jgi:hypothetical protein
MMNRRAQRRPIKWLFRVNSVINNLIVSWCTTSNTFEESVGNVVEALELVDRLAKAAHEQPTMAEFYERETGHSLAIGLGRVDTVLTYQRSTDPPYFISRGNSCTAGTVSFCYGNEPSEYLASNVVPMADGLEALQYFVESRLMPPHIHWEEL